MTAKTTLCHCGLPLHYSNENQKRYSKTIIDYGGEYGEFQSPITGKYYKVQRHYYLIHGLDLKNLDNLGFEEIEK